MIACIPTIGGTPLLTDLVEVLANESYISKILLIDNSESGLCAYERVAHLSEEVWKKIMLIKNYPETIYEGWNRGITMGSQLGQNIAILNDDIILQPGSLAIAEMALDVEKYTLMGLNYFEPKKRPVYGLPVKPVHGTFRTGGFGGFAFIVSPSCPKVDSRFKWWYGDDDLAERIKAQGGRMGVCMGAPVDHPVASTTGHQHAWTGVAAGEDTIIFRQLWPTAP